MVKMTPLDEGRIRQGLIKYQNSDITKKHIVSVLNLYKGLVFDIEPFVFNDGSRKELLNLQGTIPVVYKGTCYNIPICIWLMDTHPNNAPMCYVKPTADMHIKVSMFVDHNGKIYLPYLHDWVPHNSDLLALIQVMIVTFGEQPPVYAKSRAEVQQSSTPYPVQPFMPVPGSGNVSNSSFPPYPPSSQYSGSSNVYPPYSATASGGFPYPGSYGSYAGTTPSYPTQGYNGPYASYPPATQPSPTIQSGSSGSSGTITEEHIRASLLSAVEDKLRRRLKEQFSQLQAELETLRRTQQELTSGSSHLTDLFEKLRREKQELEKNINILQDKEAELEKEIAKLSDNQSIDVDEAVTTIAPLYKQMLNAFAEEAATEDAIYYLAEGLRSGIIDLDAFLKQVRQLSRRQFMLRALMQRCRQKAGLAG